MEKIIKGRLSAKDMTIGLVVSRFNGLISERLLEGARDAITRSGGDSGNVTVVKVPGSFEIPIVAKKMAGKKAYDAIVCLGAIIRGDTPHFDYVSIETAKGIAQASMESGVPISFGIITADNLEQAIERAGSKHGNKGEEATFAAIEMVHVMRQIEG